jgi:hypothetical protein
MKATDPIISALKSTLGIVHMYLEDLSDADLLVRPIENANHIAWQLGHLIWTEAGMATDALPGTVYPTLPAGFKELHDTAGATRQDGFSTKAFYLGTLGKVRAATIASVEKLNDAALEKPTEGSMARFAPRVADLLLLVANHTLMHAGQFTVVRRKLGKPVLF